MEELDKNQNYPFEMGFGYEIARAGTALLLCASNFLSNAKGNVDKLTLAQYEVLYMVSLYNGIYQQQLCIQLLKDRPNITRLINILEKNKLVERKKDVKNKRISKIYITQKGIDYIYVAKPLMKEFKDLIHSGVPEDQIEFFQNCLKKIRLKINKTYEMYGKSKD